MRALCSSFNVEVIVCNLCVIGLVCNDSNVEICNSCYIWWVVAFKMTVVR